jgi:hypothetical protein
MTEKRKRSATVVCTDEVWSRFQTLAIDRGKTIAALLGEVVEDQVALPTPNEQPTLPHTFGDETPEVASRAAAARTLIGFGQPVVRIR